MYNTMSQKHTGKIIGAGIFGIIVGAAAALLFSPRSGKENREKLRNWMQRMNDEISDRAADIRDMTQEKYNDLVDQVSNKYRKMKDIRQNELDDFSVELKNRWERIKQRWQED